MNSVSNIAFLKHAQNVEKVIGYLMNYGFNIRNINKEVMELSGNDDKYLEIWKQKKAKERFEWGTSPSKQRIEMKVSLDFNRYGDFILLGRHEFPVRVLGGIFVSKKSIEEATETQFIVIMNENDISKSKVFKMKAVKSYLMSSIRATHKLPERFGKEGIYLSRMKNFITLDQFAVNLVKIKVSCIGDKGDNRKISSINLDFNKTIPKPMRHR